MLREKEAGRKDPEKTLAVDTAGAVEGGVQSVEVREGEGRGLPREVMGRSWGGAIRGVMSVPAAPLSIFSHYPLGALTRDFYKGRFKERRPDVILLEQGFVQ